MLLHVERKIAKRPLLIFVWTARRNPHVSSSGGPEKVFGSEGGSPLYNTLYGMNAGPRITTGWDNSFFGSAAGYKSNTSLANNSFFGEAAGFYNTTGTGNTCIGKDAGYRPGDGR